VPRADLFVTISRSVLNRETLPSHVGGREGIGDPGGSDVVKLGATYFNCGSPKWKSHLQMVISDPAKDPERVVLVNMTSAHNGIAIDDSCILEKGDHPDVLHRSYITYARLRIPTAKSIMDAVSAKVFQASFDLSPHLLKRIQRGLIASPFATSKAKDILQAQGLVGDEENDEPLL